jgi:4-amino-4-deoxy-L-arabinose transferase-like glycosyltransferase
MSVIKNKLVDIWRAAGTPNFLFYFIVIWVAVVMLYGIRFGDLSGYDDAAYAHEARNIVRSGDWWTLELNGHPDFDKPPLFIWLLAASFKVFGATDFAAKVPGVLFGWAAVILVYFLAKELFAGDEKQKWMPALVAVCLATTQYFLKYSSHAMTDVPFTFFFTLGMYLYLRGLKHGPFLLACGIAIGLAMMTRSPMGFFPLAIIGMHLLYRRNFKTLFSPYFFGLILFAIAVPGAWYLREYALFGNNFVEQHFANFLAHSSDAHSAVSSGRGPVEQFLWFFEYIFLIVKLYLPWFPLTFYGCYLVIKRERQTSSGALLLIWLLVVFVPFSLADSKVFRYIMPIFAVFSVFSAYALLKLLGEKYVSGFARVAFALLFGVGIITVVLPNFETRAEDMRTIAPYSDAASAQDEKVVMYTSGQSQWNFQNQLLWYGHRATVLVKDGSAIDDLLAENKKLVVVMDKPTFAVFSQGSRPARLTILGGSDKFVCFRLDS